VHAVAPSLALKVPMPHGVALDEPGADTYEPTGASVHVVAPSGAKLPAGHASYPLPSGRGIEPAGTVVHCVAPTGLICPIGHAVALVAPEVAT
jgi:hypothetical protein